MVTHNIMPEFCWISIFVYFPIFYSFLNKPGCSVMNAWCPDDNLNCFHWISISWYMHHLGEDLGWDWTWASYLIKYVHNGWSCDLGIFGIPEINFPVRAFKFHNYRNLIGPHDISPKFQYLYFSRIFYAFLNELGCSVVNVWCPDDNLNCSQWILGVRMITLIVFSEFQWYMLHMSFGSRFAMGLNMSIISH